VVAAVCHPRRQSALKFLPPLPRREKAVSVVGDPLPTWQPNPRRDDNMQHWTTWSAAAALALAAGAVGAETPEDAKSLLDGALAEIRTQGLDKAVKDFNAGGKWKKDRLYLVAMQLDGTMLAHSANGKLPGNNMLASKDANGRPFMKNAIEAARTSGSGQVDLRWGNPVTRRLSDATMFVKRVPDQDVYVGSLVFK
jgi:cytochrome c